MVRITVLDKFHKELKTKTYEMTSEISIRKKIHNHNIFTRGT